ncbi:MAG: hypothetical protein PHQ27_01400 [Victivallales bacterium]|nr:hypothetical protein [Victivallales bacterium]
MAKGLAFLVLLSSILSGACLGMLSYTMATGKLPFHLQPMVKTKTAAKDKSAAPPPLDLSKERIAENYLLDFYREIKSEQEKLAVAREKLAEKQRNVDEIMKQARLMQQKIVGKEKNVRLLLDFIAEKQQDNLRRTAKVLAGMDTAAAAKLVLQWDEAEAAKVMYFVPDKDKSKLISELMQSKKPADITKVNDIIQLMQKISDQPGPGDNSGT